MSEAHRLHIDISNSKPLSQYIFGHNLEHTRGCMTGGLSAQMLRNRKFAGRPSARCGVAHEWFGIGDRAFFCNDQDPYVRHYRENGMWRRNELNAQTVQNPIAGEVAGIGQHGLYLQKDCPLIMAFVAKSSARADVKVELASRRGENVYACSNFCLEAGGWQRCECVIKPTEDDEEACIRITFTAQANVVFGAVSLMPEGHFHGMRKDVIERMKDLGVGLLRWPGGNFAGEYRWQDMFLPADMRAPLQAYTEDETQPYGHGYDMNDIDTDDFIALCREIGAEPYITLNPVWDSVEECAAWAEYCNGSVDTKYGQLRAQRGHREPYCVKQWSLGNELGYAHMEGPVTPEAYAAWCRPVAEALLRVSPGLNICSAGPYSYEDRCKLWIEKSGMALSDVAQYVSFHTYNNVRFDFTKPEEIRRMHGELMAAPEANRAHLGKLRALLPEELKISYDEWNVWAAWFRKSCTLEGLYAASMLHMLMEVCPDWGVGYVCHFQPVGEGAIDISPRSAALSARGQVFSLLKAHKGGALCMLTGQKPGEAIATVKDGVVSISVINGDYDEVRRYAARVEGVLQTAKVIIAHDLLPGSHFDETALYIEQYGGEMIFELPPRSVALIQLMLP